MHESARSVEVKSLPYERLLFEIGLGVRVVLLFLAVPVTYAGWFIPFLHHLAAVPGFDPWSNFLAQGGDARAFPYGPPYLIIYGPLVWVGGLLGPRGAALGLGITVLLLDFALFSAIRRLLPSHARSVATFGYWLSPITLYVCYWHGQLDILPVLLLTLSLDQLRRQRFTTAGIFLGLAAAAKLSMAIAIPLIWIHVLTSRRLRPVAGRMIAATAAGLAILLPFLFSHGFRQMVLLTPERDKLFAMAISYGESSFYVLPLALAVLAIATWSMRRLDFGMIFSLTGIGFFLLFLLTPASPGWAMWLAPFIAVHLTNYDRMGWLLTSTFGISFVAFHLLVSSGAGTPFGTPEFQASALATNLALSAYLVAGLAIALRILGHGVLRNPFYRSSRTPLMIGIAGDSGSGKDTLADALRGLFAPAAVATVLGDDYHRWDRHKPLWRALTHLNPRANNLRSFNADVVALRAGRSVRAPHYNHATGRMTKSRTVASADVVIVAGLHALYDRGLNDFLDTRIFLAMDEDLRAHLKIKRDTAARGYDTASVRATIGARQRDSDRYIAPQSAAADIIFSLMSAPPPMSVSDGQEINLHLRLKASPGLDLDPFLRTLIALCGVSAIPWNTDGLEILGNPSPTDIANSAAILFPQMKEWLGLQPIWLAGPLGIMQLAVLDVAAQKLVAKGERV